MSCQKDQIMTTYHVAPGADIIAKLPETGVHTVDRLTPTCRACHRGRRSLDRGACRRVEPGLDPVTPDAFEIRQARH